MTNQFKKVNLFIFIVAFFISFALNILAISDSNQTNNQFSLNIAVVEIKNMSIGFRPFLLDSSDNLNNFQQAVASHSNILKKVYPFTDSNLKVNNDTKSVRAWPISKIWPNPVVAYRQLMIANALDKNRFNYLNVGVVSENFFPNYGKPSARGFNLYRGFRTVFVREDTSIATSHEIGHSFKLCDEYNTSDEFKNQNDDEDCPNGDDNNDNILDSDCFDIDPTAGYCPVRNAELIFNLSLLTPVGDRNLSNFMGYSSGNRWVDNVTYSYLIDQLKINHPPVIEDVVLVVQGIKYTNSTVDVKSFYTVTGGILSNQSDFIPGNFTIETRDSNNNLLSNLSLDLNFGYIGENSSFKTNESPFLVILPFENVSTIRFLEGNSLMDERNKTLNIPIVNITFPLGDEILENPFNITWTASDADGGNIYYAVLISNDNGSNYTTLDIDLNQTYYELDPNDFDYGTNYVIKTLATDGVNTGNNVSNTFTLGNPFKITSLTNLTINNTHMVFLFVINNTGSTTLNNINWTLNPGDGSSLIVSEDAFSLTSGSSAFVYVEYNYSTESNFVVNATANSGTLTSSKQLNISLGNTPPTYSNFQNNASTLTKYNGIVNWSIDLSDDSALDYYVFAHNQTGILTNQTFTDISGISYSADYTLAITKTRGNYICGQFWFNDTSGNVNQTLLIDSGACFTVANTAPTTPTIFSPYDGEISNTRKIEFSSSDADGDAITYYIYINDTLNITTLSTITVWNGSDGYYKLKISATDGIGSSSNSTPIYFTLDRTPPTINIIHPINNTVYGISSIDLNWTADETVDWCAYSLDGGANDTSICESIYNMNDDCIVDSYDLNFTRDCFGEPVGDCAKADVNNDAEVNILDLILVNNKQGSTTTNITLTELSEGSHNITIYCNDTAGNMGQSDYIYFILNTSNLDVYNFSMYNVSSTHKIFEFMIKNIATNQNLTSISWSLNTGIETIDSNSAYSFNLTPNNFSFVFVEYNYTQTGDFTPIASASSGSNQDSETLPTIDIPDIEASNLSLIYNDSTHTVFFFTISNMLSTPMNNVNWTFDTDDNNVISAEETFSLNESKSGWVLIEYDYSSAGTYNVNATAINGSLKDSAYYTFTIS